MDFLVTFRKLTCVLFAVAIGVLFESSAALAQSGDRVFDANGFQQNHDYFGASPSEHVDMLTGNLILTYTDLVLPGNAGRDVKFMRVFNGKDYSWSFVVSGFPGVTDEPYPAPAGHQPKIYDESGALQPVHDLNGQLFQSWSGTSQFWKYDRQHRILYLPDGTTLTYTGTPGVSQTITRRDPFDNVVTLESSASSPIFQTTVTQTLNGSSPRVVTLTQNTQTGTRTMVYGGRTWTYDSPDGLSLHVTPPVGPGWHYEYDGNFNGVYGLTETNPHGGTTRYEFEVLSWTRYDGSSSPQNFFSRFIKKRTVGGRGATGTTASRTWLYSYDFNNSQGYVYHSSVQSPSGVVTDYRYTDAGTLFLSGNQTTTYFPDINEPMFVLDERTTSQGGLLLEKETRRYRNIDLFAGGALPELARTDIERDGRLYRTDYEYRTTNFGDFHRPYRIVESGELSRTTVRDFEYGFTYGFLDFAIPSDKKSIIGEVKREAVSVNGGPDQIRQWSYDTDNGFLNAENNYGIATDFTQANGNVATATSNGVKTTYRYSGGIVQAIQTPMYEISRTINPDGTVASETRGGRTTLFRYDDALRIVETTPPGNTYPIVTIYDNAGGTAVSVTRNGIGTVSYLDGFGREVGTDQPGGVHTRTDYDVEGRKVYEGYPIYAGERGTTIVYDGLNRVTRRINPDATEIRYTYGGGTVTARDENLRDTVQNWSAFGNPDDRRLIRLTDAKQQQWNYEYSDLGKLHKVIAPDGVQRVWNYDGLNRLSSESHPESGTTSYGYYPGTTLVSSKTDANAVTTTFTYDDNGRMSQISGGGKTTTFSYHPGTDLKATISTPSVETSFDLDAAGRVFQRRDTVGGTCSVGGTCFTQRFDYDRSDNLTLITYADGRRVQYDYDGANRISRVFDVDSGEVYARDFGYHPSGAVETFRAGNEIVHTTTYDANRYWIRTVDAGDVHLTYDNYDGVGNVRLIGDSRSGQTQTIGYDELDRLVSAGNSFYNAGYAYDAHGNRQNAGGTIYGYYPGTLRLASQSNLPGVTFGYDNNGNLISGLGTFTYSPDNLVTSSTVQGTTATFLYDAEGWRVRKTVGSLNTSYLRGINGQLLTEWNHAAVPNGYAKDYIYAGSRLIAAVKKTFAQ